MATLETALRTLNRSVSVNGSATDAAIKTELVELYDTNGNIVDKQPISRICEIAAAYIASIVFDDGEEPVKAVSTDGKMVKLTQAQYDAIETPLSDTFYIII